MIPTLFPAYFRNIHCKTRSFQNRWPLSLNNVRLSNCRPLPRPLKSTVVRECTVSSQQECVIPAAAAAARDDADEATASNTGETKHSGAQKDESLRMGGSCRRDSGNRKAPTM